MPYCAVANCKNKSSEASKKKGDISYHHFPKDPTIKEKWITATGRKDWFPTKHSTICSSHFQQEDYENTKKIRRLYPNTYPKIEVWQQHDDNSASNSRKRQIISPELENNIDLTETPRKKRLRKQLAHARNIIIKKNSKVKRLREQNRRKTRKILDLQELIKKLTDNSLLNEEDAQILRNMNVTARELYDRQLQNRSSITRSKYSPGLRSFALTLNYYSPKAYNYVRQKFNMSLPHPRTLRKWYESIDGNPGFTKESLEAIKLKVQSVDFQLFCCLTVDEMAIRRKIECDGYQFHGYIDFGEQVLQNDQICEAKEALVFLVTCINGNFKVPVGYFLADGVNGQQKKNLLISCLERLHDTGLKVVAVTFDGCPSNLAMASILGCKLDPYNLKTTFDHPVSKEPVSILLDACHMLKLIRNAFEAFKQFRNKNNDSILWRYLEKLNNLQEKENFHLTNKLRKQHLHFHNQKMKVKLASQLLSNSVADALLICKDTLKLEEFKNCQATVHFIKIFNNLFDILNSRLLKAFDFKKPLSVHNKSIIFNFLNTAETYIKELKDERGQLMIKSQRKTGFIGFLVCIQSVRHLYDYLIENNRINFLSLYRFSQDHLELFFCNVRSHGGYNNNPTSRQFKSYYKKLVTHVEIKHTEGGNCIDLEKISILNCSSSITTINLTASRNAILENNVADLEQDDMEYLFNAPVNFSMFSTQVIIYIAGFVVSHLLKKIRCEVCIGALLSNGDVTEASKLIKYKDKGGLIYPAEDVIRICKIVEALIKNLVNNSHHFDMKPKETKPQILTKVLRHFVGSNLFDSISFHQFDQSPTENHLVLLIRAVTEVYVDVRLRYLTRTMRSTLTKRQIFNKYVLFQGQ